MIKSVGSVPLLPENEQQCHSEALAKVTWSKSNLRQFATSSWDSSIRIYEVPAFDSEDNKFTLAQTIQSPNPCLGLDWCPKGEAIYGGCIDNTVLKFDVNNPHPIVVGQHDKAVSGVHFIEENGLLVSASYDGSIRFWDLKQEKPVQTLTNSQKISHSDFVYPYLGFVSGNQTVNIYDVTLLNQSPLLNYSQLSALGQESQLTSIGLHKTSSSSNNQYVIGVGGYEGRANMSYLNPVNSGFSQGNAINLQNIMTFKCHVTGDNPKRWMYPVHQIGFNPKQDKFCYTVGGDNQVFLWDYGKKSKVVGLKYNAPVTAAGTSKDGHFLAYGTGYNWQRGVDGMYSYECGLYVLRMTDAQLYYNK